jgi:Rrf2 family nitric oxide-sensitive transcriptional repressor
MRLNLQSDYALRMLMHLASSPDRLVTIGEVADRFRISHNHLMKVAYLLGKEGLIHTVRGRMEGDIHLVECFAAEPGGCVISGACRLKGVMHEAVDAFFSVLDRYTLADLVANPKLRALLNSEAA